MVVVESSGKNSAEAKHKAIDQGRIIAFKLLIAKNQIPLSDQELKTLPSQAIRSCIEVGSIQKETIFSYYYKAEINYKYSLPHVVKVLAQHLPQLTKLTPTKIYLFPILKRNKKYNQEDTQWYNTWKVIEPKLNNSNITLLKNESSTAKQLILGQNYKTIASAIPGTFDKIIVFAIGEFAFSETKEPLFTVHYKILSKNAEIRHTDKFSLTEKEDKSYVIKKATEKFNDLYNLIITKQPS